MAVAPKTREGATSRPGKGKLLRGDEGDPMTKVAKRDRRAPRRQERKAKIRTKRSKRLRSRRRGGREGGPGLREGVREVITLKERVARDPLEVDPDPAGRKRR